jgi:hypothetical protein
MLIDCDNCEVRDIACGGCVVSTLLGGPGQGLEVLEIDEGERRALDVLADVGLIPPLRHTAPGDHAPRAAPASPAAPNRRVS